MQLLLAMFLAAAPPQARLANLQRTLDAALPNDKPIVLALGNDFEAAPGTVIFASREEGIRRLIAMARAGEDELSLFFLPRWNAWVTEAAIRTVNITYADDRFCEAAMQSEPLVELWHFHNNIGVPPVGVNLTPHQISMIWTVPSELDLEEMYSWAERKPRAKFRGYVATIHGVVEYWADGYDTGIAPMHLVRGLLVSESRLMKAKAKDATVETLGAVMRDHRGLFWYRFTPVP